jgi:hypothetical protein
MTPLDAIDRSISHNERVDAEFTGDCAALLTELDQHIDSDTTEIDCATENDGSIDVWAYDPEATDGSMIWRLCVTLNEPDAKQTTIRLSGGDLGSEQMMVRCNLSDASAPVEVDYCEGEGWQGTEWQCANTSHRTSGLIDIAKQLAAAAVLIPEEEFECDAEVI